MVTECFFNFLLVNYKLEQLEFKLEKLEKFLYRCLLFSADCIVTGLFWEYKETIPNFGKGFWAKIENWNSFWSHTFDPVPKK